MSKASPLTDTIATFPAYFVARSLSTTVSCWQCGHHVAKTSSSTGVETPAKSNGPALVCAVNSCSVSPTFYDALPTALLALLGTTLRDARPTATMIATTTSAITIHRISLRRSGLEERDAARLMIASPFGGRER